MGNLKGNSQETCTCLVCGKTKSIRAFINTKVCKQCHAADIYINPDMEKIEWVNDYFSGTLLKYHNCYISKKSYISHLEEIQKYVKARFKSCIISSSEGGFILKVQ